MWHSVFSSRDSAATSRGIGKPIISTAAGLLSGLSLAIAPSVTIAQAPLPTTPAQPAPTARYAQGADVDLSEIVAEWRGYYVDVPIYLCICQDGTCDQSAQWPYREFDRYQLSVALGPNNGQATEANGFNCFDIADRSRPSDPREFSTAEVGSPEAAAISSPEAPAVSSSEAPEISRPTPPPVAPSEPPVATPPVSSPAPPPDFTNESPDEFADETSAIAIDSDRIPNVTVTDGGEGLRLDWPSGSSNMIDVASSQWNINVLNALDCESLSVVAQKTMEAQRIQGVPVVNPQTGHIAVPVLLDSCVDTDQMAVFVLDPSEGGGYALYRTQLPEARGPLSDRAGSFPNEFSSYAYSTIVDMRYWYDSLLVRQGSASGAEAIMIFRPGRTPAGFYAGCAVVSNLEGASVLCDQQ